jgi:NAD(P)-dependent dehydrogenase (short-subunit alcohol dehydrogenase family)
VIESPIVGVGDLHGRVAVVTGGGRGLGRAHAVALAAAGAAVVVNDVDGDEADAVAREIQAGGGRAVADGADVGSVEAGAALVDRAVAAFGRIDVVVNNAGVSTRLPVEELTEEHVELHLGVHLKATVGTTRAAFAHMQANGCGRIVNTISGHGLAPVAPDSAAYAAAKSALWGFTLAAALEGRPRGIAVNAVAPLALTRMSERFLADVPDATERFDPAHVARVVVWLATAPVGVTGEVLRVEGTRVGRYSIEVSELVDIERIAEVVGA